MSVERSLHCPTLACFLILVFAISASAAEFIPLGFLPGGDRSEATGISDDGLVVVGRAAPLEVFRWTDATGMVGVGFLPGATTSDVRSQDVVSADGERIVGHSRVKEDLTSGRDDRIQDDAFVYTQGQGMVTLVEDTGVMHPRISADGKTVLTSVVYRNRNGVALDRQVLFYTEQDGEWSVANEIAPFPGGDLLSISAMSPDASLVVGSGNRPSEQPGDPWPQPRLIWTAETGTQELTIDGFELSEGSRARSFIVQEITNDGAVMGGRGRMLGDPENNLQVFRWTEESGAVGLGWLPGSESEDGLRSGWLYDMTDDGGVLIGSNGFQSRQKGFVWTEQYGLEELTTALIERHGLGDELEGWDLAQPTAISPNGQFIAGTAFNLDGQIEGWLVRLDRPFGAVPEPSTVVMLMLGSSLAIAVRRRMPAMQFR